MENKTDWYRKLLIKLNNIKSGMLDIDQYIDEVKCKIEAERKSLSVSDDEKKLPIGDVEILLIALEHIGKWDDEEELRWDDPGDRCMEKSEAKKEREII